MFIRSSISSNNNNNNECDDADRALHLRESVWRAVRERKKVTKRKKTVLTKRGMCARTMRRRIEFPPNGTDKNDRVVPRLSSSSSLCVCRTCKPRGPSAAAIRPHVGIFFGQRTSRVLVDGAHIFLSRFYAWQWRSQVVVKRDEKKKKIGPFPRRVKRMPAAAAHRWGLVGPHSLGITMLFFSVPVSLVYLLKPCDPISVCELLSTAPRIYLYAVVFPTVCVCV